MTPNELIHLLSIAYSIGNTSTVDRRTQDAAVRAYCVLALNAFRRDSDLFKSFQLSQNGYGHEYVQIESGTAQKLKFPLDLPMIPRGIPLEVR